MILKPWESSVAISELLEICSNLECADVTAPAPVYDRLLELKGQNVLNLVFAAALEWRLSTWRA
jgi:hypothetical protein